MKRRWNIIWNEMRVVKKIERAWPVITLFDGFFNCMTSKSYIQVRETHNSTTCFFLPTEYFIELIYIFQENVLLSA